MALLHAIWALITTIWTWSFATTVHAMFASYVLGSIVNAVVRWRTTKNWEAFALAHPALARVFKLSKSIFGDWVGAIGDAVTAIQAKLKARADGGDAPPPPPEPKIRIPPMLGLLVVLAFVSHETACTPLVAPPRTPYGTVNPVSSPERCQSLSGQTTTWEAIAAGSAALAGAGGLGSLEITPDQKALRAGVALGTVGVAAFAAAAAVVAHDDAARFVAEGCGQ